MFDKDIEKVRGWYAFHKKIPQDAWNVTVYKGTWLVVTKYGRVCKVPHFVRKLTPEEIEAWRQAE